MASLDEEQLDRLLSDKVHGARVVRIVGQGFWALIPQDKFVNGQPRQFTLSPHWLGETYGDAYSMLKTCWNVRERY